MHTRKSINFALDSFIGKKNNNIHTIASYTRAIWVLLMDGTLEQGTLTWNMHNYRANSGEWEEKRSWYPFKWTSSCRFSAFLILLLWIAKRWNSEIYFSFTFQMYSYFIARSIEKIELIEGKKSWANILNVKKRFFYFTFSWWKTSESFEIKMRTFTKSLK